MSDFNTSDFMNPLTIQTWSNGRHLLRCARVIAETHDVTTFSFGMNQPVLFFFKPGQFITLELEIEGKRVMRSYTISSSPSIPYSISITVKRIPGGLVSNWLHDNMKPGMQLAVHGPVGNFNGIDFPSPKVLLLSGGVGITPVMSMARWWFDTDSEEVDVIFAHSARTPRDIIYAKELDYMSSRIDNFQFHMICERQEVGQSWNGYRGYLNLRMMSLIAPDFQEREIFCCGPQPYMTAVKSMLEDAGFDMQRYHEESFGATPVKDVALAKKHADAAEIEEQLPKEEVKVSFSDSGKSANIAIGTNLNEAATEAGINIPKACGVGICGACRVKIKSGSCEMDHNGGISEQEIDMGYVLSCCSVVTESLVVEY